MVEGVLQKEQKKYKRLMVISSILLMTIVAFSIFLGDVKIPFTEGFKSILNRLGLINYETLGTESIICDIRLPRILAGVLVGAGLSVSGAIFQSILRNPLADPYTIGVSTGAAFGAVVAIYLNIIYGLMLPTLPFAFAFAIFTLWLILGIAGFKRTLHSSQLILAGIIVSAIFSAGISLLKSLAGEDVSAMVFWLMGHLSAKSWLDIMVLFPIIVLGIYFAVRSANELDALTLGMAEAKSIGVHSERSMKKFLIIAALITAACVSISGVIGFVGLVVPHMVRMAMTAKHKHLIPLSAIFGSIVLVLADNISRLLFQVEIPVGVLTTLIGGPFFIVIYMNKKGKEII